MVPGKPEADCSERTCKYSQACMVPTVPGHHGRLRGLGPEPPKVGKRKMEPEELDQILRFESTPGPSLLWSWLCWVWLGPAPSHIWSLPSGWSPSTRGDSQTEPSCNTRAYPSQLLIGKVLLNYEALIATLGRRYHCLHFIDKETAA